MICEETTLDETFSRVPDACLVFIFHLLLNVAPSLSYAYGININVSAFYIMSKAKMNLCLYFLKPLANSNKPESAQRTNKYLGKTLFAQ